MSGKLQNHRTESFVQTRNAFGSYGSLVTIDGALIARHYGHNGVTGIQIVDYGACALQLYPMKDRFERICKVQQGERVSEIGIFGVVNESYRRELRWS